MSLSEAKSLQNEKDLVVSGNKLYSGSRFWHRVPRGTQGASQCQNSLLDTSKQNKNVMWCKDFLMGNQGRMVDALAFYGDEGRSVAAISFGELLSKL